MGDSVAVCCCLHNMYRLRKEKIVVLSARAHEKKIAKNVVFPLGILLEAV